MYLLLKYLVTAGIVVLVSELAKRNDKVGALVASLPLVTVLTLIWLFIEKQPMSKLNNHMYYTFWYVLPILPMFLAFPWLLSKCGFWIGLIAWLAMLITIFLIYAVLMKKMGIDLL